MVYQMETSRGGLKLVDDLNYIYRFDRKYGEKTYWKCDSMGCKARVHTKLEDDSVSICKTVNEHCHPAHPSKPKVYEAKKKMKSAATNSQTSSRSLIAKIASSLDSNALALLPTKAHLSRSIRGWRQKENQAPPIPTGRSGYIIPGEYRFLENGDQFLLYDSGEDCSDRILVFGTKAGLDDLEKNKDWACDGTFKCSPEIYYQLFTLHIVIKNISIPRIFVLLPDKSQVTYSKLFSALKDLRPSLQPETLMVDFEKASINAFSAVFSTTKLTGCLFHMVKNIYRHIVDLGLKSRYQTDAEFNNKIKCLTALAFLPVQDVIDGFIELSDDDDLPQELVSYFEMHYIGGERGRGERRRRVEPTFPIALWNIFERVKLNRSRTNNSIEGYHNALQSSMTNMHPNLWKLISYLKKEEILARKKKCDLDRGDAEGTKKVYSDINTRLQRQVIGYNSAQKRDYIRSITWNLHTF
ncbi:uncharacterized protein [Macrobrachium rosenbergii]|uniref:uncharacterized protein n=1 Tax=Macrobrachium rosenbergii TaxID=79674 RepID=UPI0034D7445A